MSNTAQGGNGDVPLNGDEKQEPAAGESHSECESCEELSVEGSDSDGSEKSDKADENARKKPKHSNFFHSRDRKTDPELPTETTIALRFPLETLSLGSEDSAASQEEVDCLKEARIFIVGTAHFSEDSQRDVKQVITETQPDAVMLELCPSRLSILSLDEETLLREAKNLNREKMMRTIREYGALQGVLHLLLLSMSAHITKQLGMAPGGEFRAACQQATEVKRCQILLIDRPIQITLKRALGALNWWQKLKLFFQLLISQKISISKEEVERCKQSDMLEELLREMAGEFPELSRIFVGERDQYMTEAIRTYTRRLSAAKQREFAKLQAQDPTTYEKCEPVSVVAVVGIGHSRGIADNWTKPVDMDTIIALPPPSRAFKLTKTAIKGVLVGVSVYAVYKGCGVAYSYFV